MLELVITISIIATLGLIAIPRFNETRIRHRDENTARVIHRATEHAIAEARRRTATVTIALNAQNELLSITAVLPDTTSTEIPWKAGIAGESRKGGDAVSWSIVVDPHGRVNINNMPSNASLAAALSSTASEGTGIKKGGL